MSILPDSAIKERIQEGILVESGEESNVGPSCYEITFGGIYYDLTEGITPINVTPTGNALIKPGHRVVLISKESLNIPSDILARVYSKGSLFSIGLSPISTYADPGFKGNLGIVTQNMSEKYIVIPVGEKIGKIDFDQLIDPCDEPYFGQHGYQTEMWPIKEHLQKKFEDVEHLQGVGTAYEEATSIMPDAFVTLMSKMRKKQRIINRGLVAFVVLNITLLGALSQDWVNSYIPILTNLVTTALVGVFLWNVDEGDC